MTGAALLLARNCRHALAMGTDSDITAPWPSPDEADGVRASEGVPHAPAPVPRVGIHGGPRGQASQPYPYVGRARGHVDATTHRVPLHTAAVATEPELKAKYLEDWQVMKRARFDSAARLERRNSLSLMTLSSVALYGGLVTVFVLIFRDSFASHARNIFDWVAAVASWLTLTFSLTEQIKDHNGRARQLHDCARKINDLRKRLQASYIAERHQLNPYIAEYDAIIAECVPNHDEADFQIARLHGAKSVDGMSRAEMSARARRLRRISSIRTHAPYILMMLAPAIAGLLAWSLVPVPVSADAAAAAAAASALRGLQ